MPTTTSAIAEEKTLRYEGTVIVLLHALPLVLHSLAHVELGILLPPLKNLFVLLVIVAGPFVAMALLWTRWRRLAAWGLLLSMAGSLAFGVYHHYVMHSPDHVSQVATSGWGAVFRVTAALLAGTEAAGCYLAGRFLWVERGKPRPG